MVEVLSKGDQYVFNVKGLHKFWALTDKVTVAKNDVVTAYQNNDELKSFSGFRLGTHIPFLITAGTYYLGNKTHFWDMVKKKNTIIVALQNHRFNKLYIEVENPENTLTLLNSK